MEKFKIYSNDPYDFDDLKQIKEFYNSIGKKDVAKKIEENSKGKIYLKILADKREPNVEFSLMQERKSDNSRIKLPDLVLDYEEIKHKDVDKYLDMTEYQEFD